MIIRIILFLVINFAGLGLGGMFTGKGVASEWYDSINKAPWTPPGWVFGFAWTTIMICFAIYMAVLWNKTTERNNLVILFSIQWLLNFLWNPIFFHFHNANLALVCISVLTVIIGFMAFNNHKTLNTVNLLIMPYFIWLLLASSLNAYIVFNN